MGSTHEICPYAYGFIPQELTCRLAELRDSKLSWWRKLWHGIRGDYCCMMDGGTLPCPVLGDYNEVLHKKRDGEPYAEQESGDNNEQQK